MKEKICKLLSIVLTVALVISCCTVAFDALAETTYPVYYISPKGSADAAGTFEDPLSSVNSVITKVGSSYDEDDTVYIKAIKAYGEDGTTEIPNLWDDDGGAATIVEHAFKLNISSNDTNQIAQVGNGGAITYNGAVEFSNIKLGWSNSNTVQNLNGNDLTIGEGVSFNGTSFNTHVAKSGTHDRDITINFNGAFGENYDKSLYLGGDWNKPNLNGDINLNFNSNNPYTIYIATNNGGNYASKFNRNINFNVKKASSLTVAASTVANGKTYFGENSAVQFINSAGLSTAAWVKAMTDSDRVVPPKYFIINNTYGADVIEFTKTAGKFKINLDPDKYDSISLISADKTIEKELEADGTITVTESGEYTLKTIKSGIYYIKPDADITDPTNDGLSPEKPLKSVNGVIAAAKAANYGEGDTVYIKAIKAYGEDGSTELPNLWDDNAATTITEHEFKLNISSHTDKVRLGTTAINLSGDVDFENITIYCNASSTSYKNLNLNNNNINFGENSAFANSFFQIFTSSFNPTTDLNLYFACELKTQLTIGGNNNNLTFGSSSDKKIDVNVTVNSGKASKFYLGDRQNNVSKYSTTYNFCNLNFNLKSTSSLTISSRSKANFTSNAAIQFIDSTGVESVSTAAETYVSSLTTTDTGKQVKYYIINTNKYGADAIEFTKTAGKYKVNLNPDEYDYIALVSSDGSIKKMMDINGYITVTESGEYTLQTGKSITYYIKPDADTTNNGLSYETPLKSVNGVIVAANAAGYGAGDTVYIKAIKTFDTDGTTELPNLWDDDGGKADLTAYKYKLNISSYKDVAKLGSQAEFRLTGDTDFSNIIINNNSASDSNITLKSYNISFGNGIKWNSTKGQFSLSWCGAQRSDIDLYFTAMAPYLVLGSISGNSVFNYDINVTVDGAAGFDFRFGDRANSKNSDGTYKYSSTYNKNINFNIKNASTFNLSTRALAYFSSTAAVQVINSTGNSALVDTAENHLKTLTYDATITDEETGEEVTESQPVKYFIIQNSYAKDAIEFTKTAGKFKINLDTSGYENIVLLDANGDVAAELDSDGYITVTELGEYTLQATKKENLSVTYYVSPKGFDINDGTETSPFNTIEGAVRAANKAGYGVTDNVNLKAVGTINWGTPDAYGFTLNLTSANIEEQASIELGSLKGDLVIDNINITNSGQIYLSNNSITVGEGAPITSSVSLNLTDGTSATIADTQNVIINTDFKGKVIIGNNSKDEKPIWSKDLNIVVNNANASPKFSFYSYWAGTRTINGNLNFVFNKIASATFYEPNGTSQNGSYKTVVNGAVQILAPADATLTDIQYITNWKSDNYYLIKNFFDGNIIEFTDVAGEYNVNYADIPEGYIAVLKNVSTDEEAVLESGLLELANDNYEIRVIEEYTNAGEKIKAYKACEIDLSQEKHLEKDGKLFIGWQKADGSWASTIAVCTDGEILTAKYIDFTLDTVAFDSTAVDFAIDNITLTEDGGLKLNVGFTETNAISDIPNVTEKGVIWSPTDYALGHELRVDENIVRSWTWDSKGDINAFTPNKTLDAPNKVTNSNTASIEITDDAYNTYYTARGYIKYTDKNGIESIIYTVEETSSAYKVASEATDSKGIYTTIIDKVKAENKAYADGVTETVVEVYDKTNASYKRNTDSYDVFSNITGAGDYVKYKRDTVLTNTGAKETINLGWITDMHIFGVSQTDVDKQMTNILATYRGSPWLRYPTRMIMERANDQMNYMTKRFTKTIVTGDVSDNYSYGSYNAVKALVGDKSVNGSVLMTTGNHEFFEFTNPDISGLTDQFTTAQKYDLINQSWANDPYYYSEILKTSKGEDNAMIILLDNGSGEYPVGTATKLQASIDEAKQKNIPVLIFQHIPMSTYNSTETKVCIGTATSMGFATSGDTTNMSSYDGNEVLEVQAIVRKNYDIIKGVFAGHTHRHFYTEITAIDENGNIIEGEYIPQFVTGGADQDCFWVNQIVVEASDTSYNESFNEKTTETLYDWKIDGATNVENGKLNLSASATNSNITSYNQYLSADVKATDLTNGFEIRARVNGDNYYSFKISGNAVAITKAGTDVTTDTFEFDSDNLYRVSFSAVGNVLTAYIHDYTDGGILKTLSYTDDNVHKGTKFGFVTAGSGVKLDNVYFSPVSFNANDNGWVVNDINGDRVFDIRDLVYADENAGTNEENIIVRADKSSDKIITAIDIKAICKLILGIAS